MPHLNKVERLMLRPSSVDFDGWFNVGGWKKRCRGVRRMGGVGVVIPAYNEAERIERVLQAVLCSSVVKQVVIVDDGSVDGTYQVATKYAVEGSVEVMRLPTNMGKAMAFWVGVQRIVQPIVVMLDADLIGLLPKHIEMLAEPISCDDADMTIGVFCRGRWITDWSHKIAPEISGQRGLRKELLLCLPCPDGLGYGLEAFLNWWASKHGWKVKHVMLEGVSHVTKEEKLGLNKALIERTRMYWDIGKTLLKAWVLNGKHRGKQGDAGKRHR